MKREKKKFLKGLFSVGACLLMIFFILASCAHTDSMEMFGAVDENGFDSQGRLVAYFGSPVVDGAVDELWSKAPRVTPEFVSENITTSANFRIMWDDRAIYFLAEVKDDKLSVESGNPYMQDSLEIFLDEKNDKTKDYGVDDLHFRVNYKNAPSVDVGSIERFYTAAQETKNGYVIEARIAFKYVPSNQQVLGVELQINDGVGANRAGTINVFDSTNSAWMDTGKFGNLLLTGKTGSSNSGLNPYDLMTFIKISKRMDLSRYRNPEILTEAIELSEELLENKNITQKQIDQQFKSLQNTIESLELTEMAANEKDFVVVPDAYRAASNKQGTIETLEYTVANLENGTDTKTMNVYLPFGYKSSDTSKKYNVLYLMHGGGENENTILGKSGDSKELRKIIDNMIANGDIDPLIIVTPSFYGGKNDTAVFHEELMNNIVPLIESKYNTFTESTDEIGLKASRAHRAFGGFSMGSVTTWYIYINCLDYFKYYLPLSGDCWVLGRTTGNAKSKEIAAYLAEVPKKAGYTPKDYYIFSATGDQDIAYPNLKPQIDAMKELTDSFIYSSNTEKGNFYFMVAEGGTHAWNWVNQYIYGILPDLF